MKPMLTPTEWPFPHQKWIFTIIFVSALHFQGIAQDPAAEQKSIEKSAFWNNAYKAAEAYFSNPSPKNAEMFAKALPEKRDNWPSDGQLRLANLVFDFDGIGMRKNFSILENDINRGEPHAADVGFRLINISDGLSGEETVFILGKIADEHPQLFLQKLKDHIGKTQPDVLELYADMMHPVAWWEQQEDEAGYPALLEKRLNIRVEALRSVKNKELRELRDLCLKILEDSLSAKRAISGKIDRIIIREVDLTRDGKPEKVVLHVTGKDFKSPFTWTITIHSNGRKIFYLDHADDEQFDKSFNDPEFWGKCHDYISCKSTWYFTDVMRLFLYTLEPIHLELMASKESFFTTFDEINALILKTGKATPIQANRIVEELKRDIQNGKAVCINPEINPVSFGPIYLWIPVIDDFVYIYDD